MTILFHITAGTESWIPTDAELGDLKIKFQTVIASNNLNESIVATRSGVFLNIITGPNEQQQNAELNAVESN